MTAAQQAYQEWKLSHKVNLQVFTDEQLFCIGYESRDNIIKELENKIEALTVSLNNKKGNKDEPREPTKPTIKRTGKSTAV